MCRFSFGGGRYALLLIPLGAQAVLIELCLWSKMFEPGILSEAHTYLYIIQIRAGRPRLSHMYSSVRLQEENMVSSKYKGAQANQPVAAAAAAAANASLEGI